MKHLIRSLFVILFLCYNYQAFGQLKSPNEALDAYEIFVSLDGNDNWSGELAEPNENHSDGPLASLEEIQRRISKRKGPSSSEWRAVHLNTESFGGWSGTVIVWIREGTYRLTRPLVFNYNLSGPIIFAAYPNEKPVISGGKSIENWKVESINGKRVWVKNLPEVANGSWYFRSLYVNGKRAVRPRLPKKDFFWVEDPMLPEDIEVNVHGFPCNKFKASKGDLKNWSSIEDAEIVLLHFWIEQRLPIENYDPESRIVTTKRISRKAFVQAHPAHGAGNAPYYIENVFEALTEPGEWYLNRETGNLYYIPLPGETLENTMVVAPVAKQLVKLVGEPEANKFVEHIQFKGLTFTETDWCQPGDPEDETFQEQVKPWWSGGRGRIYGAANQGAMDIRGVIYLEGARYCGFEKCKFTNLGWTGIEIADGCRGIRLIANEISETGGGGIKINGSNGSGPESLETGSNRITDNHIHSGGRIFHSAMGVLIMYSFSNLVAHNLIHDFYYTGIQVGWGWSYAERVIRENRILNNHIYDIGQEWLSDMGGIYTLSTQPGTVLKGNLIHDINAAVYGAQCLYLDDGTSYVIAEDNICFRTNRDIINNKGRENVVRNNILAFGEQGIVKLAKDEPGVNTFTFYNNILITDGAPVFRANYFRKLESRTFKSDLNLFWDIKQKPIFVENLLPGKKPIRFSYEWWQNSNLQDRHSLINDPECLNWKSDDYSISSDSPATEMGFVSIDMKNVGPRKSTTIDPDTSPEGNGEVKPFGHIE